MGAHAQSAGRRVASAAGKAPKAGLSAASQKALDKVFAAAGGKNFKGEELNTLNTLIRGLKTSGEAYQSFELFAKHPQGPDNLRFFHWIYKGSRLKPAEAKTLTKKVMNAWDSQLRSWRCYTGDPKGIGQRMNAALKGVKDCENNPLNKTRKRSVNLGADGSRDASTYDYYGGDMNTNPHWLAKRVEAYLVSFARTFPNPQFHCSISAPTGKLDPKILTRQNKTDDCSLISGINAITLNPKANKLAAEKMIRKNNGLEITLGSKPSHVTDMDVRGFRNFAGGDGTGRAIELVHLFQRIEGGSVAIAGLNSNTVIKNLIGKEMRRISPEELILLKDKSFIANTGVLGHSSAIAKVDGKFIYVCETDRPRDFQKYDLKKFKETFRADSTASCYV